MRLIRMLPQYSPEPLKEAVKKLIKAISQGDDKTIEEIRIQWTKEYDKAASTVKSYEEKTLVKTKDRLKSMRDQVYQCVCDVLFEDVFKQGFCSHVPAHFSLVTAIQQNAKEDCDGILRVCHTLKKCIERFNTRKEAAFFFMEKRELSMAYFLEKPIINMDGTNYNSVFLALEIFNSNIAKNLCGLSGRSTDSIRIISQFCKYINEDSHAVYFHSGAEHLYNVLDFFFEALVNYDPFFNMEILQVTFIIKRIVKHNPHLLTVDINPVINIIKAENLDILAFYLRTMREENLSFSNEQLEAIAFECNELHDLSKICDLFEKNGMRLSLPRRETVTSHAAAMHRLSITSLQTSRIEVKSHTQVISKKDAVVPDSPVDDHTAPSRFSAPL